MEKTVLIIGGGIAGLSAGVYAQMNGYRARIYEMHTLPGGLCTSWSRKGYTIDGCLHWLVGSSPRNSFYRIWEELGAIQGKTIVDHEEFTRVVGENGKELVYYTDIDRFERHLLELSKEDEGTIKDFARAVRRFAGFDAPIEQPGELLGVWGKLRNLGRMAPFLPLFLKYGKLSIQDFAKRFQDPFLKESFARPFDMPDFPLIALMVTLAWMNNRAAGYPVGGSLVFARSIEKRFLDLGGEIQYGKKVEKILVENDQAVGIKLADGTEERGDWVVSAADGHFTLFEMLEGKFLTPKLREYYDTLPTFPPIVQVSVGVDRDLSSHPHSVSFPVEPFLVGATENKVIGLQHYGYDPTMAPSGKSILTSYLPTDYRFWKELYADREKYRAAKEAVANEFIRRLDLRFPGLKDQVEMVDVATPVSYERYTGNWKASWEGWLITTKTMTLTLPKRLPGLKKFFMIGQWVQPGGGLPPAALHGRQIVQLICHEDEKPFTTRT